MADKDIVGVMSAMRNVVDHWHLCDLPSTRAASATQLQACLLQTGFTADAEHSVQTHNSVQQALSQLSTQVPASDRIVIFGSFVTVEQALLGMPRA